MTEDHLSYDELAELAEGLLVPDRAAAAQAHLGGCAQCQERAAAIASVTADLADLPPVTMPPEVAARLEQALADAGHQDVAQAGESATGDRAETGSGSVTVIPDVADIRRHRRWSGPTMATSAVAAVLVLLVGALVIAHLGNGSSSGDGSSGGVSASVAAPAAGPVGANATKDFATASTGRVYTAANLATLVPGLVTSARHEPGTAANGSPANTPASGFASSSRSGASASASAAASPPSGVTLEPSATSGDKLSQTSRVPGAFAATRSHAQLLKCAAVITSRPGAVPEVIDFARWTGGSFHHAPSIIAVFNGPRPGTVAVYVVSPHCDPNQPNLIRTYTIVTTGG